MVGVSLAFQSAHTVHLKATVRQAPGAASVHASAPWYLATDAGRSLKKLANT
jgi:RNA:NAD 2'-phosphotransferase (TPT1/KptA family)